MHVGARRDLRFGAPALINAVSVMNLGDALATFRLRGGYDGWPHEEPRATSSEVHAFDSWAGGHTCHLSPPAAATFRGPF